MSLTDGQKRDRTRRLLDILQCGKEEEVGTIRAALKEILETTPMDQPARRDDLKPFFQNPNYNIPGGWIGGDVEADWPDDQKILVKYVPQTPAPANVWWG